MPALWIVRGARQLLTLRGRAGPRRGLAMHDLGVIAQGALLVRDGTILEVGTARRIENLRAARNAGEIDLEGRIALPAFVDPCVDLLAGAGPWEGEDTVPPRRPGTHRLDARAHRVAAQLLRHGTATFGALTARNLEESDDLESLRIFRRLRKVALDAVPFTRRPPSGRAQADYLRRRHLAAGLVLDLAAGTSALRQQIAAASPSLDLRAWAGDGGEEENVALALQAGAVSVDGLLRATETQACALATFPAVAVLLASQFAAGPSTLARALIDRGVAVAISSGFGFTSLPTFSQQASIELARRHLGLRVEEAITAATVNAAHAATVAHRCGSLETGKLADLTVLDCADYREIAHCFGVNLVHRVFKTGEMAWSAE